MRAAVEVENLRKVFRVRERGPALNPIYLVWQKLMFVLGGLFVPLALYPAWLLALAHCTPFPALIHGPGSMAFGSDPTLALHTLGLLVLWSAVAVVLLAVVYRRGLSSVDLHGG
jgi:ABC-2 type transport system permease protein